MAKRILLVDYESHSSERARGVLREPDYEIVPAHDGEEALNTFSSSRFDLVLLSGMLPRLPSAEVIREIRRRGGAAAPPILLMVSGYKGSNTKADAQRVGAFDLLPRPFSDDALRQAAAEAIATAGMAKMPRGETNAHGGSALTSSDIFSDILEEVDREAPGPAPTARIPQATHEEVEKRLRDTLSGVMPKTSATSSKPPLPKSSTDSEVERLLSMTLPGLKSSRPGTTPAPQPPPLPEAAAPAATAARPEELTLVEELSGPDRFGQYEILERIASGGMAELFRARRSGVEGFQKIVAIKKILPHIAGDEEFIKMFADEAKVAALLSHPNIVHIFDLGKIDGGGYFIAMEHVEGHDLRYLLHLARETGLKMPVPLAVAVAAKVASALDYAHRRRGDDGQDLHIVHRDVSPPNILVSSDGDIKLCDFGIAKAASKVSRTESGSLKGKVPYMSPEQAWGKPVDQRSDIYSLGAVLFEMATGRKLFQGETDLSVLEKVRAGAVVMPSSLNPDVPPALDAAVLKALALEPDERYFNASDLLRDLDAVLRTYEPPPSSADLASYVRHLEAADLARRAGTRESQPPAAPTPSKKPARPELRISLAQPAAGSASPSTPAPPETPAAAPPPPPESPPPPAPQARPAPSRPPVPLPAGIFASFPEAGAEQEKKKRTRLYALIAAAAVVLAAVVWLVVRKPAASPPASVVVTAPPLTAAVVESSVTPVPTQPSVSVIEPKAQEESPRQLAAKRREMQKAAEASATAARSAEEKVPALPSATPPPARPSPEAGVAEAPPTPAEPTAVPVVAPSPTTVARAAAPAPETAAELARGDLVGPGPGVVEPVLLSYPRITYPAAARQQGVSGKVVVLLLVNEQGTVSEAKLQQGLAARFGVNDAVLASIRQAKFQAATKNGIPVKMWRTLVVDVKP